ncbi:hypothetical protein WME89_00615 [Sorangium sp. So ce321]
MNINLDAPAAFGEPPRRIHQKEEARWPQAPYVSHARSDLRPSDHGRR